MDTRAKKDYRRTLRRIICLVAPHVEQLAVSNRGASGSDQPSNYVAEVAASAGNTLETLAIKDVEYALSVRQSGYLTRLRNLKTLILQFDKGFEGTGLPEAIFSLNCLTQLKIASPSVTELSPSITKLSNLKVLCLENGNIGLLPRELSSCSALTALTIRTSPELFSTTSPHWRYNWLTICLIRSLRSLDLCNCGIRTVCWDRDDDSTCELTRLCLSSNNLSGLDKADLRFPTRALQELDISSCNISALPHCVPSMAHLKKLDISHNNFVDLEEELRECGALEEINAAGNSFPCLPLSAICGLSRLERLDCRECMYLEVASPIENLWEDLPSLKAIMMQKGTTNTPFQTISLEHMRKLSQDYKAMNKALTCDLFPETGSMLYPQP